MQDKQSVSKKINVPCKCGTLTTKKTCLLSNTRQLLYFYSEDKFNMTITGMSNDKAVTVFFYHMSHRIQFKVKGTSLSFRLNSDVHTANKCLAFFCWVGDNVSAKNWCFILSDSQVRYFLGHISKARIA